MIIKNHLNCRNNKTTRVTFRLQNIESPSFKDKQGDTATFSKTEQMKTQAALIVLLVRSTTEKNSPCCHAKHSHSQLLESKAWQLSLVVSLMQKDSVGDREIFNV